MKPHIWAIYIWLRAKWVFVKLTWNVANLDCPLPQLWCRPIWKLQHLPSNPILQPIMSGDKTGSTIIEHQYEYFLTRLGCYHGLKSHLWEERQRLIQPPLLSTSHLLRRENSFQLTLETKIGHRYFTAIVLVCLCLVLYGELVKSWLTNISGTEGFMSWASSGDQCYLPPLNLDKQTWRSNWTTGGSPFPWPPPDDPEGVEVQDGA